MATATPFKVKAIYAYTSEHDDDLNFPQGQIITVTDVEDADWYIGEYTSAEGEPKSGLFPNNFVEKYEPAPPPRPTRAARPKAPEAVVLPSKETTAREEEDERRSVDASVAVSEPAAIPQASKPALAATPLPQEIKPQLPPALALSPAPKSDPAPVEALVKSEPAKKGPPPVAEKSSSFKDRLAAFNKQGAAPVTPFKPGGASSNTFIKKPFVAPPPSRHAYVPPVNKEPPPVKVYRREEDPEIAQRQAEDEEAAQKAGFSAAPVPSQGEAAPVAEGDNNAPKPVSLKERIALLQKQQQEQAAKRADATVKQKPARPPKKRVESQEDASRANTEQSEGSIAPIAAERATRDSSDAPRDTAPPPVRRSSRPPAIPQDREVSDGNEADHSAAGEPSADDGVESSTEEEPEPLKRHPKAPVTEAEIGDQEDEMETPEDEEDEEEEEMDEEARRQQALRERMAKLSGGMGMGAMFGPPGGMPMPGLGGGAPAPSKKKPKIERRDSEDAGSQPQARVPMVPIPGMGSPAMSRSMSNESEMTIGKEQEDEHSITSRQRPEEMPDVEDVKVASPRDRAVPPLPPPGRLLPQPPLEERRGLPPAIPGGRPSIDSRPPPSSAPIEQMSESEGSEADDEIPNEAVTDLPIRGLPLSLPGAPKPAQNRMSIDSPTLPLSPISPTENKRASRLPPPIPGAAGMSQPPQSIASPTMPPAAPSQGRAPPPPPPTAVPPTRQGTTDSLHRRVVSGAGPLPEEGSEYEGDYDTDIASGEKHRDALKTPHGRDSSFDDVSGVDTPMRSPPIPQQAVFSPTGSRAVPPPPPTGASKKSGEQTRGAPPPLPGLITSPHAVGDDYDPFNYTGTPPPSTVRSPPPLPPAATRQPPLPPPTAAQTLPAPPPVPSRQEDDSEEEDEDEDDLYSPPQPPPRRSTDQAPPRQSLDRPPPPLPPQAAPSNQTRAPPPLPPQATPPQAHFEAPPALPRQQAPGQPSTDQERSFAAPSRPSAELLGRPSMSGARPAQTDGDFIARDLDLGEGSRWWTQTSLPPPSLQNRSDVGYEVEQAQSSNHGGKTIASKDVYALYQDYSQTIISVHFDAANPVDVSLEQRHEPPPGRLRQDQLENWWTRYGASIARSTEKLTNASAVGDGSAHALVISLLQPLPGALAPVGTRAYGALVYANLGNATVQQYDEIRSGDIVSFRNAKFSGKHGGLHQKYSLEVREHVGVVVEWDGTKKKVRVAEQGREKEKEKKKGKGAKVEVEGYRLEDLRSGEVRVWRVVGREFVGWGNGRGQ